MPIRGSPNGAHHTRPQPDRAGRDRPEQVVVIDRKHWSPSIGTAGRHHPARAFNDCRPPFDGWRSTSQLLFATEWFDIAKETVFRGITVSLPRANYETSRKETGRNVNTSVYGQCCISLVEKMSEDKELWGMMQERGVSFFVESGNPNNAGILEWFNRTKTKPDMAAILKSMAFIGKDSCRAIQLADYLAFYSRRHAVVRHKKAKSEMSAFLQIAKDRVPTRGHLAKTFGPIDPSA